MREFLVIGVDEVRTSETSALTLHLTGVESPSLSTLLIKPPVSRDAFLAI